MRAREVLRKLQIIDRNGEVKLPVTIQADALEREKFYEKLEDLLDKKKPFTVFLYDWPSTFCQADLTALVGMLCDVANAGIIHLMVQSKSEAYIKDLYSKMQNALKLVENNPIIVCAANSDFSDKWANAFLQLHKDANSAKIASNKAASKSKQPGVKVTVTRVGIFTNENCLTNEALEKAPSRRLLTCQQRSP